MCFVLSRSQPTRQPGPSPSPSVSRLACTVKSRRNPRLPPLGASQNFDQGQHWRLMSSPSHAHLPGQRRLSFPGKEGRPLFLNTSPPAAVLPCRVVAAHLRMESLDQRLTHTQDSLPGSGINEYPHHLPAACRISSASAYSDSYHNSKAETVRPFSHRLTDYAYPSSTPPCIPRPLAVPFPRESQGSADQHMLRTHDFNLPSVESPSFQRGSPFTKPNLRENSLTQCTMC